MRLPIRLDTPHDDGDLDDHDLEMFVDQESHAIPVLVGRCEPRSERH